MRLKNKLIFYLGCLAFFLVILKTGILKKTEANNVKIKVKDQKTKNVDLVYNFINEILKYVNSEQSKESLIESNLNEDIRTKELDSLFQLNKIKKCTLETCMNWALCNANSKSLKLFLYNRTIQEEAVSSFFENLSGTNFEFVDTIEQACFVIIVIREDEVTTLVEFLFDKQESNFLFVDIKNSPDLSNYFSSLLGNNLDQNLVNIVSKSFLSSFNNHNSIFTSFFLHFSVIFAPDLYDESFNEFENKSFEKSDNKNGDKLVYFDKNQTKIINRSKFLIFESNSTINLEIFIQALKYGTIPVLIGLDTRLPLDSLILWDEVCIRIPLRNFDRLDSILQQFDESSILERQIMSRNVYNAYFSGLNRQFHTLVASLKEQLNLEDNRNNRHALWNIIFYPFDQNIYPIKPLYSVDKDEKFTLVINSYQREALLAETIDKYLGNLKSLDSILIVRYYEPDFSQQFKIKFKSYLGNLEKKVMKNSTKKLYK
jgi:hypothetical protein